MRSLIFGSLGCVALALLVSAAPGCSSGGGGGGGGDGGDSDGGCVGFACNPDAGGRPGCVGLECQQITCEGGGTTSLSGTVYDPAGKVPIYNATVYVPNGPLSDLPEGASCDRCDAKVTGSPVVIAATDTTGKFKLDNVPVGSDIPLVVQIGKWRRKITVPSVSRCADTPLAAADTRLPKNRAEGNIPRMALTTGAADPLQCLLLKAGIDASEFGVAGSDARIHLYQGGGYKDSTTTYLATHSISGANIPTAQSLWDDPNNLKKYDVVLMGCEGGEIDAAPIGGCTACGTGALKSQAAKTAMYDYAKAGGRVFASHFHYVWFSHTTDATVKAIASWSPSPNPGVAPDERTPPAVPSPPATTAVSADISAAFPKAQAMATWLGAQGALASGKLPIYDARHNIDAVSANALGWVTVPNANVAAPNDHPVQYMSFNTPIGAADTEVCGRVVVNDIHVAAGQQGGVSDDPTADFPSGCKTTDLTAQQKALEFMLFDLSSCVQKDDQNVIPPR